MRASLNPRHWRRGTRLAVIGTAAAMVAGLAAAVTIPASADTATKAGTAVIAAKTDTQAATYATSPSWPSSKGSVKISGTIKVSGTFDGGMKTYCCIGSGGQSEGQDPMFKLSNGATIQNVILGSPAGDGIHCEGTCTIKNVWWNDVGEDGATFKGTGGGTSYVIGGGAKSASDKLFQHNGNGTVSISGFYAKSIGKLYRACGNCSSSYQRHVKISDVYLDGVKYVAGINSNWGDTATMSKVVIANSSSAKVCAKYKGVSKGSEPSYIGVGWSDSNCKVAKSDVTFK